MYPAEFLIRQPAPVRVRRAIVLAHNKLRVAPAALAAAAVGGGRYTGALRLIRSDSVPVGRDPADYPNPIDVAVEVEDHVDARERYAAIIEQARSQH